MRKPKARFESQPSVVAILKMMAKARGSTVAEIAAARNLELHSVRAVISRLGTVANIKISRVPDPKRGSVYCVVRS